MKKGDHREVVFFGRITASVSHELKNVLAIIKESAGLIQDILMLSGESALPHQDKLNDALCTINEQIERGGELTSRLNRFAHDPDEPITSVDLNELAAQLVALCARFARLKKIELDFASSDAPLIIRTSPIGFQITLFAGIECCFDAMPSGGRITIRVDTGNGEKRITIACDGTDPAGDLFSKALGEGPRWVLFVDQVEALAGRLELDGPARSLSLFLPEVMDTE